MCVSVNKIKARLPGHSFFFHVLEKKIFLIKTNTRKTILLVKL